MVRKEELDQMALTVLRTMRLATPASRAIPAELGVQFSFLPFTFLGNK